MSKLPLFEKTRATKSSWPQQVGVVMLLLFYLAAFVYSPVGVPHLHHEEDVHHGDSCEKDACHIAIFHPGGEGECDHKFHFTQAIEECDLCHAVLPRQVIAEVPVSPEFKIEFSTYTVHTYCELIAVPFLRHDDRGPPVLI